MEKIQELTEKRAALMHEAQDFMLKNKELTAELRAKFDTMMAEVDSLEADISRYKQIAKFEEEFRARNTPPRPVPGADGNESDPEKRSKLEKRAFEQFFKRGISGVQADLVQYLREGFVGPNEQRDLLTSGTGPAYLIPQGFLPVLIDAMKFYGPIMSLVRNRVTNNNGAPIKVAFSNDTANAIAILGEATTITETDPAYTGVMLNTDTVVSGLVKVSWQELADSYFDLESYLKDKFGKRFGRGTENYITNGNGSNVASLLAAYNTGTATASPTAIAYPDLAALYGSLDPAYIPNSNWVMNSKTRGALIGTTDSFGRPLFDISVQSNAFDTIIGRPVVLNQSMPNIPTAAGTVAPVLFGDFNEGYLFRMDGTPSLVVLRERYADTLENGYFSYQRIGGIATNAGTNPIKALTMAG